MKKKRSIMLLNSQNGFEVQGQFLECAGRVKINCNQGVFREGNFTNGKFIAMEKEWMFFFMPCFMHAHNQQFCTIPRIFVLGKPFITFEGFAELIYRYTLCGSSIYLLGPIIVHLSLGELSTFIATASSQLDLLCELKVLPQLNACTEYL